LIILGIHTSYVSIQQHKKNRNSKVHKSHCISFSISLIFILVNSWMFLLWLFSCCIFKAWKNKK